MKAATLRPDAISSLVLRGGRPDLAEKDLGHVKAPTLLIVGGNDEPVLSLNRRALQQLAGPARLSIVAGASHLFEEPGAMDNVIRLTVDWFSNH